MLKRNFKFEVVKGSTEHITFNGKKIRRPTVLIRVGSLSLSKKALILGATLALCQVLDGVLTYIGLSLYGVHMEGNAFLHALMQAYGAEPVLVIAKCSALAIAVVLTFYAHRRRWVRPLLGLVVAIYFVLAVLPWTYLIARATAANQPLVEYEDHANITVSAPE